MLKEYLSTLANALRSKLGITDKINAQNFPDKINEVYDKGKYDEWSEFWDNLQQNGTRINYDYAFYSAYWNDNNFKPKYNLTLGHGVSCYTFKNSKITDLEAILKKQNILLTLQGGNCSDCFSYSTITVMPAVNVSNVTSFYNFFNNCKQLHTIRKLTFKESQTFSTSMFNGCTALANIEIGGVIGTSFRIAVSPLSTASIVSIIEHLSDNSTEQTLTLKQTAVNAMSFPFTSEQSGITYNSWDELIANKTNWTFSLA